MVAQAPPAGDVPRRTGRDRESIPVRISEAAAPDAGDNVRAVPYPAGDKRVGKQIEDVITALKARGVRFQADVINDKAGKFAMFADPDGNPCYLYQMIPSYAPR